MRKVCLFSLFLLIMSACKINEPDVASTRPLSAIKIDDVQVTGKKVTLVTSYSVPTPCWFYYRSESSTDDKVFTCKAIGKFNGDPCVQVIGSIKHKTTVSFLTPGIKTLRFWQSDSTYLDTVISIH